MRFSLDCHGQCDGAEVILALNLNLLHRSLLLVSSFRLADTNRGNLQTSPLPLPLVVRVFLAEKQNIIWFCYKDICQGWQLNSVLGLVKLK